VVRRLYIAGAVTVLLIVVVVVGGLATHQLNEFSDQVDLEYTTFDKVSAFVKYGIPRTFSTLSQPLSISSPSDIDVGDEFSVWVHSQNSKTYPESYSTDPCWGSGIDRESNPTYQADEGLEIVSTDSYWSDGGLIGYEHHAEIVAEEPGEYVVYAKVDCLGGWSDTERTEFSVEDTSTGSGGSDDDDDDGGSTDDGSDSGSVDPPSIESVETPGTVRPQDVFEYTVDAQAGDSSVDLHSIEVDGDDTVSTRCSGWTCTLDASGAAPSSGSWDVTVTVQDSQGNEASRDVSVEVDEYEMRAVWERSLDETRCMERMYRSDRVPSDSFESKQACRNSLPGGGETGIVGSLIDGFTGVFSRIAGLLA